MIVIVILLKWRKLSIKFLSGYYHRLSTFFIILLNFFSEMIEMKLINGVIIDLVSWLK